MPSLPFPAPTTLSSVDVAVRDKDDVVASLPREYRLTDIHPVLDALATGLAAMAVEHQSRADYAAAQSDPMQATDEYLSGLASDRGVQRADGELDPSLRARVLSTPKLVTPNDIVAAINEILASVTTAEAQVFESILDAWFVSDGTDGAGGDAGFNSFVGDGLSEVCPRYPDRLYPDDAVENLGDYRPQSSPGGAIVFADDIGRHFVVRVPELNDVDAPRQFAGDGTTAGGDIGMFVGSGASAGLAFVSNDFLTAEETYQAIVDTVQRMKGHGIRWTLLVDRKL